MPKRVRRGHRRERARTSPAGEETPPRPNTDLAATEETRSGRLVDRLLDVPHLAEVVPRLQPEVIHRVIQQCGLEDCGQFVALATPDQLARVFDLDLWRPPAPGLDEQFDADRFGTWLDVMVDAGVSNAAATLAGIDVDLVAAGFAQHVRVFDAAVVGPFVTLDGQEISPGRSLGDRLQSEVGGYVLMARRTVFWDAITTVLAALAEAHGDYFAQVMSRCRRLSNSRPEIDGLDDLLAANEQAGFDLALDREGRRDTQGYVTPAQARAFLQASRRIDIRHGALPPRDPMTLAYFAGLERQPAMAHDPASPDVPQRDREEHAPDGPADAVAAITELLHESGVVPRTPRALLADPHRAAPRFARLHAHLQFVHDHDVEVYATRSAELAYLANVLVAGSTIQARPIAPEESSQAAVAVCNLGLENWPALAEDFLVGRDLVGVFQLGWTVLHEDVCMYAAEKLIGALAMGRCADPHVHSALEALHAKLTKQWRAGSPWEVRDDLDVVAILDMPAWAGLLGLIDQFPTLHAAVGASVAGSTRQIDPSAFEFISEKRHLQQIREFLDLLPGRLFG